jgi:hypothetical protein
MIHPHHRSDPQLALHPDCVEALAAKNVFETAMTLIKAFTGVKGVGAPVVEASLTVIWNAICGAPAAKSARSFLCFSSRR